ncbi:N-acetyltransferase [Terrihabitans soli]|uniref:N-acetyltransferase n=1 Tax=Terrihabitans soli TaxID=708113 RepID=A0A6S6QMD2_9HYPH|nr:N-acetyltransferase [Terrihabitans soli]BCJ90089.1 N-acetyltransferase [Terrihabitans soli]
MTSLSISILPEAPEHSAAIESLHDRGFGPGRFARTAFRLREGVRPTPGLSYVALVGTLLVGSVRLSPIRIGGVPALLLGPLAVEPAFMNRGIGTELMKTALDAAREQGHALALLVGDEPFYAKSGFTRIPHGKVRLPGPVDPDRLLVAELKPGVFADVEGLAEPYFG